MDINTYNITDDQKGLYACRFCQALKEIRKIQAQGDNILTRWEACGNPNLVNQDQLATLQVYYMALADALLRSLEIIRSCQEALGEERDATKDDKEFRTLRTLYITYIRDTFTKKESYTEFLKRQSEELAQEIERKQAQLEAEKKKLDEERRRSMQPPQKHLKYYKEVRLAIYEKGLMLKDIEKKLGFQSNMLSQKLRKRTHWQPGERERLLEIIGLDPNDKDKLLPMAERLDKNDK